MGMTPTTVGNENQIHWPDPHPLQTLFTVPQLAHAEPALKEGSIRYDVHNRNRNGLAESGALVYRGSRILIHRELYLRWLMEEGATHKPRSYRGPADAR